MPAGNRSPLGFGVILLFHLCVLASGVLLQKAFGEPGNWVFAIVAIVGLVVGGLWCVVAVSARRFLWDMFRSFKSAGVLLSLLVLSCVGGTLIIQDLDLRRDGVFEKGIAREGEELPPFDDRNQSTRFALAEAHAILWLSPSEERTRLVEEKVKLSEFEKRRVALRRTALGHRKARAFEKAVLASKRREVDQLTTSNYARQHHKGFYNFWLVCRNLHLFDTFEAWWFNLLLLLIAVNVTIGTIARAPWSARDIGVAITHAGILIILGGAFLDYLVAQEGYIHFKYGNPQQQVSSVIRDSKTRTVTHLPFRVRLDRFATEYYHEMLVERYDWKRRHDGRPWSNGEGPGRSSPFSVADMYPVRAGVPRVYEDGQIKVIVHAYKPRVFVRTEVEDDPNGQLQPAVKLGLYDNKEGRGVNYLVHGSSEPWLFAFDARRGAEMYDSRFEVVWAESDAAYRRLKQQPPLPDNGRLVARLANDARDLAVTLGAKRTLKIGGRNLEVEFLAIQSVLKDAEDVNLDRRAQRSEAPLLVLRVDGQIVRVPRDDSEFVSGFGVLKGVELRFDWPNPKENGVFSIYRIVAGENLPPVLVQADAAGRADARTLRQGETVALLGRLDGAFVALEGLVRSARAVRGVTEVTDEDFLREGGGAKDNLLAAWADVEVQGPQGTIRRELTPYDRPIFYPPQGRPLFAFALRKTNQQRDWFSVLTVLDHKGEPQKSHPVQVNSPLRYDGWRFFQATAGTDQDGFAVSGISVTKNPGVNYMYVGYTVLTLGVCYIFFVRPGLDRRRRRRRRAEAVS